MSAAFCAMALRPTSRGSTSPAGNAGRRPACRSTPAFDRRRRSAPPRRRRVPPAPLRVDGDHEPAGRSRRTRRAANVDGASAGSSGMSTSCAAFGAISPSSSSPTCGNLSLPARADRASVERCGDADPVRPRKIANAMQRNEGRCRYSARSVDDRAMMATSGTDPVANSDDLGGPRGTADRRGGGRGAGGRRRAGDRGDPSGTAATGRPARRPGAAGRQPRMPGAGSGAAGPARRLPADTTGPAGTRGRHCLARQTGHRTGGTALRARPSHRFRGGVPDPGGRSGPVVRGRRRTAIRRCRRQIHLVHRRPAGLSRAHAADGVRADADSTGFRGDRPHHHGRAHRSRSPVQP